MRCTVIQPASRLKPYVRHFLLMESNNDPGHTETFRAFADGCPGLVFQQIPGAFYDHQYRHFPPMYLHGLTTKYIEKTVRGSYSNIIACLHPHSIKTIFGVDAGLLTDRHHDVKDILKTTIVEMLSGVTLSTEEKLAIISEFIVSEAAKHIKHAEVKVRRFIELLEKTSGIASLNQMIATSGISERSVERLFVNYVGISPKLFSRIQRFQSTINKMNTCPNVSLSSICYDFEYSDQSHCIREFKEFSGTTPKQFLQKAKAQVLNFPQWS